MTHMLRASSLEPLTTLRILSMGMQCVARTTDPKCSQIVSIICKGGLKRVPNLKCTQIMGIITHGGAGRILSMGMLRISQNLKTSTMLQLIDIEDTERPLWLCILSDLCMDLIP
jgi:hypothetical protein